MYNVGRADYVLYVASDFQIILPSLFSIPLHLINLTFFIPHFLYSKIDIIVISVVVFNFDDAVHVIHAM